MAKRGRPRKQQVLALVPTVEVSKLEGAERRIYDLACQVGEAMDSTREKYRELVVFIHDNFGDPKRAGDILLAAGLPDYVASKIKTVAFALPDTYEPYAKGQIGFKATVETARDDKAASKSSKNGKPLKRSQYQKLFNECSRLLNRGKLDSAKPVVKSLKGGWYVVLWNQTAPESLPAILKAAGYISRQEAEEQSKAVEPEAR